MPRNVLTEQDKKRIFELCEIDGKSQKKVADFYDVSQSTVSNVIKEGRLKQEIGKRDQIIQNAASYGFEQAMKKSNNSGIASLEYNIDNDED